MSLLFIDGFDDRNAGTNLASDGKGWSGSAEWEASNGRRGSANFETDNNEIFTRIIPNTHPVLIVGWAYAPDTGNNPGVNLDEWMSVQGDGGSTQHITLNVNPDASISIMRGETNGTELDRSATGMFTEDVYAYYELKVYLHDTDGYAILRKNEVVIAEAHDVDTKNGGTTDYLNFVEFRGMNAMGGWWDDIYICNGDGSVNNDFLGDCYVITRLPEDDGSQSDWTPSTGVDHYALVDENPPNTTDYVSSDTPGDIDYFLIDDLEDTTHQVFGVQVGVYAAKDDAGGIQYRSKVLSDASVANGAPVAPSTTYGYTFDVFEADPDGGGAWTPAQVNAAEFGVEVLA